MTEDLNGGRPIRAWWVVDASTGETLRRSEVASDIKRIPCEEQDRLDGRCDESGHVTFYPSEFRDAEDPDEFLARRRRETDAQAIADDWRVVGEDMKTVMRPINRSTDREPGVTYLHPDDDVFKDEWDNVIERHGGFTPREEPSFAWLYWLLAAIALAGLLWFFFFRAGPSETLWVRGLVA